MIEHEPDKPVELGFPLGYALSWGFRPSSPLDLCFAIFHIFCVTAIFSVFQRFFLFFFIFQHDFDFVNIFALWKQFSYFQVSIISSF